MRSTLRPWLSRSTWISDRRGNVAMLFALMLPVVVGGAAFGVETTYWYYKRLALQGAADAAAYSGAYERRSGANNAQVESVATLSAVENGFDAVHGSVQVSYQNPANGGAVVVVLSETAERFFTAYFTQTPVALSARAVATYNTAATACLLALHPTQSKAADFSGSSDLKLTDCSVMSNSSATDAVNVQGSGKLRTDCVIAVGGVSATSGLTMTDCAAAITNAPPVADPFKDVPAPTPSGPCKSVPNGNGNYTLDPGHYCGAVTFKNGITLNPGTYVIDGDVTVNANANVSGTGVTLYVTGGGHVKMFCIGGRSHDFVRRCGSAKRQSTRCRSGSSGRAEQFQKVTTPNIALALFSRRHDLSCAAAGKTMGWMEGLCARSNRRCAASSARRGGFLRSLVPALAI